MQCQAQPERFSTAMTAASAHARKNNKGHPEALWTGALGGFAALRNRVTLLRLPEFLISCSLLCAQVLSPRFFCLPATITFGEDTKAPAINGTRGGGPALSSGKFAEAEASYQALVKTDSKLVPAEVGLVRAMLRQQKIDEALDAVNAALVAQPDAAALLAAKGEVQFRRAEMSDAELSYLAAKKLDRNEVHAYLGLARLYRAYSMYHIAYGELQIAHQIAPDDIDVQRAWQSTLPRKERLAAFEAYLAGSHPDNAEETKRMTEYLEFLKATADKPAHECRLVSKVQQTETSLESREDASRSNRRRGIDGGGLGLSAKLNDLDVHFCWTRERAESWSARRLRKTQD